MGALILYLPSIHLSLLLTSAHTGGSNAVPTVCGTVLTVWALVCLICWTTFHFFLLAPPALGCPSYLPFPGLLIHLVLLGCGFHLQEIIHAPLNRNPVWLIFDGVICQYHPLQVQALHHTDEFS